MSTKVFENEEEFVIENDDFLIEQEILEEKEVEDIEGFFSSFKKYARKAVKIVNKIKKIPVVGDMLPPSLVLGANFLNKLSKAEKKTGKKIKFSLGTTKAVYANAFMKGRIYERKRIRKDLRRMK